MVSLPAVDSPLLFPSKYKKRQTPFCILSHKFCFRANLQGGHSQHAHDQ